MMRWGGEEAGGADVELAVAGAAFLRRWLHRRLCTCSLAHTRLGGVARALHAPPLPPACRLGVRLIGPKPEWVRSDGGEGGTHPSNVHDHIYAMGGWLAGRMAGWLRACVLVADVRRVALPCAVTTTSCLPSGLCFQLQCQAGC